MLLFPDGAPFATGNTNYEYRPISPEGEDNRILLRVEIEQVVTLAIVDTGATYAIIEPSIANIIQLDPATSVGKAMVRIRGEKYQGLLYRLNLTIPATHGEGMVKEVTAFIPDREEEGWGNLPSFLGIASCLEFLRFAVDPATDTFYFGSE